MLAGLVPRVQHHAARARRPELRVLPRAVATLVVHRLLPLGVDHKLLRHGPRGPRPDIRLPPPRLFEVLAVDAALRVPAPALLAPQHRRPGPDLLSKAKPLSSARARSLEPTMSVRAQVGERGRW
eukprot:3869470-Rhodomonas_salina.1